MLASAVLQCISAWGARVLKRHPHIYLLTNKLQPGSASMHPPLLHASTTPQRLRCNKLSEFRKHFRIAPTQDPDLGGKLL